MTRTSVGSIAYSIFREGSSADDRRLCVEDGGLVGERNKVVIPSQRGDPMKRSNRADDAKVVRGGLATRQIHHWIPRFRGG